MTCLIWGNLIRRARCEPNTAARTEYIGAVKCCQDFGIQVYADAVLNHRMAADDEEEFNATPSAPDNRYHVIGEKRRIRSWTSFTFPGRTGDLLHAWSGTGGTSMLSTTTAGIPGFRAVWRIEGREFDGNVDLEKGNYDYLNGLRSGY